MTSSENSLDKWRNRRTFSIYDVIIENFDLWGHQGFFWFMTSLNFSTKSVFFSIPKVWILSRKKSLESLAHTIEVIDLSRNELSAIPEFLYECTALKRLNLSENQISEVHLQIDKWQQIEVIKISSNNLTSLPASLSKAKVWNVSKVKGAPIAKHFSSYVNFWIRHGSKWSPAKFQSDDVIVGSTGVKLVENWSSNFG